MFNDPFDCKTGFHCGNATEAQWRRHFAHLAAGLGKSKAQVDTMVQSAVKLGLHKKPAYREAEVQRFHKVLGAAARKLGILCMSEVNNNILMWSHYSNGHRGLCLQFDKERMERQFHLERVRYRTLYPSFQEFLALVDANEMGKLLTFKSQYWEYEAEWRAIHNIRRQSARVIQLKEGILTGIILGCQVGAKDRARIERWIGGKQGTMQLYQSRRNRNSYGVRVYRVT
jgi:hypothetical protein